MRFTLHASRSARGFTLIEVLVAISIMAVIMTLLWSSSGQSLRAKERVENRDMVFHAGGVALRKLSEDLVMAFLAASGTAAATQATPPGQTPTPAPEPVPAAGTTPETPPPFKTFFIGKDEGDADAVSFTTLSHLRFFKDAKESDQCKVAYEVVPSETEGGGRDLDRREDAWLYATTEVKGDPLVLVENIRSFEVEYYDLRKAEWVKGWNTEQQDWKGRLPFAVRTTIVFADPDDEEKTIPMSTAVTIPLARGAIQF